MISSSPEAMAEDPRINGGKTFFGSDPLTVIATFDMWYLQIIFYISIDSLIAYRLRCVSLCDDSLNDLNQLFYPLRIVQKVASQVSVLAKICNSRITQDVEVLRNIRLGDVKKLFEVVHACFPFEQDFDYIETDWVSESLEDLSFLVSLRV